MIRQTLKYLTRMNTVRNNPDVSQNVLDHIPKAGIIGYSTNNDKLAWELLSEPSERFGFTIKDFSRVKRDETMTVKDLLRLSDVEDYVHDVNDLLNGRNLQGGDPYSSRTVVLNQFPDSVSTAKELEEVNGGVNLFLHLNFEKGLNWEVEERYQGCHQCTGCGRMLAELKENETLTRGLDSQGNTKNMTKMECNCGDMNCQFQHTSVPTTPTKNTNMKDLHVYLDSQGLFVNLNIDKNMDLTDARIELIKTMANNFKL